MTDLANVATLGIAIDSSKVKGATGDLKDFEVQSGKAEKASERMARQVNRALAFAALAGIAAYTAGIAAAVKRMDEMERLSRQLDRALANTGNAARTSAAEVEAFADRIENATGRAAEEIMMVSTNLATFGFGREQFFRAIELADDMAAAWGGDLKQNVEGLARALAEPEKGLAMLSKRGIEFTDVQTEMIAGFLRANDLASAQGVIFEALEEQVKGVAEAGFGGLPGAIARAQKAWDDAFEDLVRGDGVSGDLRDTLIELTETLSSPDFIAAVMAFGNVVVKVLDGIAQVAIGAHKAFQDFMAYVEASDMKAVMPEGGTLKNLFPDDYGAAESDIRRQMEWRDRWNKDAPSAGDLYAGFDTGEDGQFKIQPPPGSMLGKSPFDPYGDNLGGGGSASARAEEYAKLTKSILENISVMQVEAETIGMTEYQTSKLSIAQELLRAAAEDGRPLTAGLIEDINALANKYAEAELTVAGLQMTMENRSPWEVMGEEITRLNELMDKGKISASTYWAEVGKAAERTAGVYASAANGILGQASKLTEGLAGEGEAAFNIQKAISIASAIVNGGEAIVKSYNWGSTFGGPIGGGIAAGIAAAATAAQIGMIASTSFQSKSPVSSAGGGASMPSIQNAAQRQQSEQAPQVHEITFRGVDKNKGMSPEEVMDLARRLEELSRDGQGFKFRIAS